MLKSTTTTTTTKSSIIILSKKMLQKTNHFLDWCWLNGWINLNEFLLLCIDIIGISFKEVIVLYDVSLTIFVLSFFSLTHFKCNLLIGFQKEEDQRQKIIWQNSIWANWFLQ